MPALAIVFLSVSSAKTSSLTRGSPVFFAVASRPERGKGPEKLKWYKENLPKKKIILAYVSTLPLVQAFLRVRAGNSRGGQSFLAGLAIVQKKRKIYFHAIPGFITITVFFQ